MAKLFGSQIDLQKIPVLGLVAESSTGGPSSPVNGQFWYDTTNQVMKVRDNGAWVLVGNAAGGSNPTGPAGGDLTGSTYPNPVIAALAVTGAKIANATITDTQVAAANKDGAVGTASMRTLGNVTAETTFGSASANGSAVTASRSDHTHGNPAHLTAAHTAVVLSSLAVPTAALDLNSQQINNLAAPTNGNDATNKTYVDNLSQGLSWKDAVRVATTANITIATALNSGDALDGVTLANGDRVLVKNQSAPAENGIYVVSATPARATDADVAAELEGAAVFIMEGTAHADQAWVMTTNAPITLGTTGLTWAQFGAGTAYIGGAGLALTGTTFDVGGTTNRITVAADSVDIAATYVGQTSITTVGTITAGTWTGTAIAVANGGTGATNASAARSALGAATVYAANLAALSAGVEQNVVHNLTRSDVHAQFSINANGRELVLDWRYIDANTIGVTADIAYAANAVRVVVIG